MTSLVRKSVAAFALTAALLGAAALGYAQARPRFDALQPQILSGDDIGFRVERHKGSSVAGRFMVRIEGRWIPAEASFEPRNVTGGSQP